MNALTICSFVLLYGASLGGVFAGQKPTGPKLYNLFGLGGYDPFGQLRAPIHAYSGPYFDEGPIRRVNYRRKRDTSYSAPSASYGAPSSSYGAPSSSYGAPSSSYGAPSSSYGAPSYGYGTSSYASYGGGKGGRGKKGGRFMNKMRSMFKGMGKNFDKFRGEYLAANSYGGGSHAQQTYYAPSYIPVYYQTYDNHRGKKGANMGKFFKNMGSSIRGNFKKGMDTIHGYGDSAIRGMKKFGSKTKNRLDKLHRETVGKMKKYFYAAPEPIHYIPVEPYHPPSSYGPPSSSYGAPSASYGPPPSSGHGALHGKHGDIHLGGPGIAAHGHNDIHIDHSHGASSYTSIH